MTTARAALIIALGAWLLALWQGHETRAHAAQRAADECNCREVCVEYDRVERVTWGDM